MTETSGQEAAASAARRAETRSLVTLHNALVGLARDTAPRRQEPGFQTWIEGYSEGVEHALETIASGGPYAGAFLAAVYTRRVAELPACWYQLRTFVGIRGLTRYSASCEPCDVVCSGWTEEQAIAEFEKHRTIPAPPVSVLAQPLTPEIVAEYPHFYIDGRGRQIADNTDCAHGYLLTSSCPLCP
ncbi:hypothetical protein IU451_28870 [Nocardia cyriacigeorgica]|uniref:hypothetical protein n=1 Tax=Nocardia cyriacigeorgica TaxID=135487 RepID=UPI00189536E1|nr:hypothetical protein [Nocardia cyriacigeorgica]MBF6326516.1 hypothetical protein [Nocardia cyriacigeorgica]